MSPSPSFLHRSLLSFLPHYFFTVSFAVLAMQASVSLQSCQILTMHNEHMGLLGQLLTWALVWMACTGQPSTHSRYITNGTHAVGCSGPSHCTYSLGTELLAACSHLQIFTSSPDSSGYASSSESFLCPHVPEVVQLIQMTHTCTLLSCLARGHLDPLGS